MAFQIVLGSEQALAAGLALAFGDGAERVEPTGNGGEETLLGFDVRRDRPEQRRLPLICPVGATEALDGSVRFPSRLEQIVDPQPSVPR